MITRSQLEIINRKTLRYPLQVAEKDYFLTLISQIIAASKLGKILIFKGGTAIHHCYLDQLRFSEDLDFSSNQTKIALARMKRMFKPVNYLKVKKDYVSGATVKLEKLQYTGPLIQPNSLKVEVDFVQNVLLPPEILSYHNVWGIDFNVRVMDVREIAAEKIRAASDRARYRDFYDLYLLLEKYSLDLEKIIDFVKQKEIRRPISKDNIIKNWEIVVTQKEKAMGQIYYSKVVKDSDIKKMIRILPLKRITG